MLRAFGYSAKLLKLPKPVQARLEDGSGLLWGYHLSLAGVPWEVACSLRKIRVSSVWSYFGEKRTGSRHTLYDHVPFPKQSPSAVQEKFYNDSLFDFVCMSQSAKIHGMSQWF